MRCATKSNLAEYYAKRNEATKAVVTYRKVLKLSPQDVYHPGEA